MNNRIKYRAKRRRSLRHFRDLCKVGMPPHDLSKFGQRMTLRLQAKADCVNRNGVLFTAANIREIVNLLNRRGPYAVPITPFTARFSEGAKVAHSDTIGCTIPGTARVVDGHVMVEARVWLKPMNAQNPHPSFGAFKGKTYGSHPTRICAITRVYAIAINDDGDVP